MSVKDRLAGMVERVKGWAHSVPPDVWIGLAIAAATLIVVYRAYKQSQSSSNTGLSTSDPIIGASNTPGTTSLGTQDVLGNGAVNPGTFDLTQLWTQPKVGVTGAPGTPAGGGGSGLSSLTDHLMTILNRNETNGQNATIAAFNTQQAQQRVAINTGTTRDESLTAAFSSNTNSAYPTVSTAAVVNSATTRDESTLAKIIQAVKPQPKASPAPIRPSPFAITSVPTGRGVNVSLN